MLDVLSDGFSKAFDSFKGKTTLNESNIENALGQIRRSLLEADVEYGVAKNFLARVKERALGQEVALKAGKGTERVRVSAGDHFVQICLESLTDLMGPASSELELPKNRPASIMMVGLQGSGKTTSTGKLAKYLIDKHKRRPLLVAADIYRPAAVDQLKVLGERLGVPVFSLENADPVTICAEARKKAFELECDTIMYDTAGRLTIDEKLMGELVDIKKATHPDNILLVCDAMMGQDAVTTAKSFDEKLDLTGIVMTKLDGDARGGAALSVKEVIGKPIKFLGMGEDLSRLEEFRPDGLASRILGMGDIVGLMEDFEKVSDQDREADALKMLQGQFTFKDFYEQISMIQKMGSLKDLMGKLPIGNMIPKDVDVDDRELLKIKVMIDSMTQKERDIPDLLNESRMQRIARGSGRPKKEVQELVERFKTIRGMMGNLGKSLGIMGKIPGLGGLNQLNKMRKMAKNMMPGGLPADPAALAGMQGLLGGNEGPSVTRKNIDREKLKKLRKAAKNARKRNRKR